MKGEAIEGTVIGGKYRVARALGSGGMGNVYLATHTALGTQVALKMLRRDANDDEVRARFQREGVLAAQLDSDHVVRVTDLGWADPETPYLVMELLEGRDLQDELDQRKSLPISEAIDVMLQALTGVAAAHAAGLVHRDIKPANLFLARRKGRAPVVKVLDFGLSKALQQCSLDSLTHETARFGTPVYMSPEQIRSTKNVDARADQYALAAVLYQCLTGRLPFESASLTELFVLVSTAEVRPPSSFVSALPSKLDKAVLRGLAKEPDRRFADVLAFAEAIVPFGGPRAGALLEEVRAALAVPSERGLIEAAETEDSAVKIAARSVEDELATPPMNHDAAPLPGGLYAADDQAKTLLRAPPQARRRRPGEERASAADDSQVGLTSSMNEARQTRRRFALASAVGGLVVLVGWFAGRALWSSDVPGPSLAGTAAAAPDRGAASPASASGAAAEAPVASSAAPPAPTPAPSVTPATATPSDDATAPRARAGEPPTHASTGGERQAVASSRAELRKAEKSAPSGAATARPGPRPSKAGEKSVLDVFGER